MFPVNTNVTNHPPLLEVLPFEELVSTQKQEAQNAFPFMVSRHAPSVLGIQYKWSLWSARPSMEDTYRLHLPMFTDTHPLGLPLQAQAVLRTSRHLTVPKT